MSMGERPPHSEEEDKRDNVPESGDAAGSSADQAKEREAEMEESGEENAG
jgi:hypothetical protein